MLSASTLGALPLSDGRCSFRVWAPRVERVEVHLVAPRDRLFSLERDQAGYFQVVLEAVAPGDRYFYRLDSARERPDPASRFQPQGVHGPSQIISPDFRWQDQDWFGLALPDYVIYELHVGTFTPEGTFAAIIPRLEELQDLGITAVELMPVAQFPGERNWGYDGAFPFAAQNSYGGPEELRRLVDACHRQGVAVVLDVVYNHLGPEGNYLSDYGPYFTDLYRTPWGNAVNFDGPYSDEVRRFFLENALYWIKDCHIDGLRLDGLHAVFDNSPHPFLAELAQTVHAAAESLKRRIYLMVESDRNDVRLIRSPEVGGYGLDAHWNEDFHHSLHTLLTGEKEGYYRDFGRLEQLAKGFREGFIYSGEYSVYRHRRHGSSSRGCPAHRFIVFSQNHDQVGNRLGGERLTTLVSWEALKLAAGVIILSPFLPLFFMGEEYGEVAPFLYFISHQDPELVEAVRRGRQVEFGAFGWQAEPPDPQSEETFRRSKLNHEWRRQENNRVLWEFYRELLRVRRQVRALDEISPADREVWQDEEKKVLWVRQAAEGLETALGLNFGKQTASLAFPWPQGRWEKLVDSSAARWRGPGSQAPQVLMAGEDNSLSLAPQSFTLFIWRKGET